MLSAAQQDHWLLTRRQSERTGHSIGQLSTSVLDGKLNKFEILRLRLEIHHSVLPKIPFHEGGEKQIHAYN